MSEKRSEGSSPLSAVFSRPKGWISSLQITLMPRASCEFVDPKLSNVAQEPKARARHLTVENLVQNIHISVSAFYINEVECVESWNEIYIVLTANERHINSFWINVYSIFTAQNCLKVHKCTKTNSISFLQWHHKWTSRNMCVKLEKISRK